MKWRPSQSPVKIASSGPWRRAGLYSAPKCRVREWSGKRIEMRVFSGSRRLWNCPLCWFSFGQTALWQSPQPYTEITVIFPEQNEYKTIRIVWKQTEVRSRVTVEVAVLGSPSLTVPTVSEDVKQHWPRTKRASELRNCVKVQVAILDFQSLLVRTVS